MTRISRSLAALPACLLLLPVSSPGVALADDPPAQSPADKAVLELMAEDLDVQMRRYPTWASGRGDRRFDHLLDDPSPQAAERHHQEDQQRLEKLRQVDKTTLSPARRIDAELLEWELQDRLDGFQFKGWLTPVSQMGGAQRSLPQMPDRLTFPDRQAYENYLARLKLVQGYLEQIQANLASGLEAGLTPPQVVMERVPPMALEHGTAELAESPEQHAMFKPFLELKQDDALRVEAREVIKTQVVPAFRALGEYLRDTYVPACRTSLAATARPDGAAYYASRLRHFTTTDLTAEQIHQTGLDEVKRIRAEMFEVIEATDFDPQGKTGDALFAAFLEHLRSDRRFYFDNEEDLLDAYRAIAKKVDPELPKLFGLLPRLPYGVRKMPDYIAPSSPTAYYYSGSLKTGKAGYFVANTYKISERPRYNMVALTLHEACPGHHLQIALAQESEERGLPEWRTIQGFTVFSEGWALYSERLGLEMGEGPKGLYSDPYDDFGRLTYEMWRAMRLVVDTGIHAKGWTRDQAIDFMLQNSALTRENVAREVDRYIAWPGQAVAYKLGELKIRELRARAEQALGDRFDLRGFHDTVLGQGAVPVRVLERQIAEWVKRKQAE